MFLLPMLPLAALLGVGMHSAWRSMPASSLLWRLRWPAVAAVVAGIVLPVIVFGGASVLTVVAVTIGSWVCISSLLDPLSKLVLHRGAPFTRAQLGMCLAHFGVGVFILGATVASAYNLEIDATARPGDRLEAGGYEFVFRGLRTVEGANFTADEGEFELRADGAVLAVLTPQKRVYRVQQSPMTEAAIDSNLGRDVFLALGEPLGENAWSVRIQVKPLIGFLWLGSTLMVLGGLAAISDRRYREPARERSPATAASAPAPAGSV
jgi:cytochrome c-type biogenesis protein CcmF